MDSSEGKEHQQKTAQQRTAEETASLDCKDRKWPITVEQRDTNGDPHSVIKTRRKKITSAVHIPWESVSDFIIEKAIVLLILRENSPILGIILILEGETATCSYIYM